MSSPLHSQSVKPMPASIAGEIEGEELPSLSLILIISSRGR